MFLFIAFTAFLRNDFNLFKYISCSYLSNLAVDSCAVSIIQIHLMFLFILLFRWKIHILHTIQIHLMFLFIVVLGVRIGWNRLEFKYISCSYLSGNIIQSLFVGYYSNTSHVLIYHSHLARTG